MESPKPRVCLTLLISVLVFFACACTSPSLPGRYLGHWKDLDGSDVSAELVLTPDGRAFMNLQSRSVSGGIRATSWEARYRVEGSRIVVGSEGTTYAILLRKGKEIVDPNHLSGGKPILFEKREGY
ncbi:conserved hypothetical protein [Candidatus Methylacidithermus pantelleriae]|uniref:Lipoprotein n=2 Tax=Candidatus Methylacidithermus pantelleriae TaxID=2744239 RepID=A0A8J2BSF2_9BACT|nr:conserved hypothetical protein [Candidatus Methylacidithermus pantelleriae]